MLLSFLLLAAALLLTQLQCCRTSLLLRLRVSVPPR
jgi:hypothetical protein